MSKRELRFVFQNDGQETFCPALDYWEVGQGIGDPVRRWEFTVETKGISG
jgi:hypothetical protein